jgi:hypothetical protein
MKAGASAAEVVVKDETDFSVTVRLGEVETLTESERARRRSTNLPIFRTRR